MADDLKDRGPQDRSRVNVNEEWELRWWSTKWAVTTDQLLRAVAEVGPSAEAVAKKLGKSP